MKSFTPQNLVKTIIWTNVILFLIALFFSGKKIGLTLNPLFALSPSYDALVFLGGSGTTPIDRYHDWWTLLTASWLHGSLLHILFNMLALRTVAPLVINEFGMSRMFSIYTLTGAAGFFASYLGQVPLSIGASSGICGLIGALLYFGKSRGGDWGQLVFKQTKIWIISLVVFGLLIPNIDNWGHGGGLAAGIVLGWVMGYREKRKENLGDYILSMTMALVTSSILIWTVGKGIKLSFF